MQANQHRWEQRAGAEQLRLDRAQGRQKEVLRQARAATNGLLNLLAEVNGATAEATILKTNTDGQTLALHPDLLAQARLFYDVQWREMPVAADIIARLEDARRLELQMLSQQGTAFEPPDEILAGAGNAAVSAERDRGKVQQIRDYLASLVRESKIKYTQATLTTNAPHLEDAIKTTGNAEAAERRRKEAEQTAAANLEADRIRTEEKAKGIIADAERDAAKIRAEAEEKKAALEREMALKKAQQQTEAVKTKVAVATAADEDRKIELRKKASDPAVQGKLAPFITPGHAQIGGVSPDALPHSLSKLRGCKALDTNSSMTGLRALLEVAISKNDTRRPRWTIDRKFWVNHPADIEKIKGAQALLIELGPVLVEMGKLQP